MTEILDMSRFIEAKSDQLNSDDLIGTSKIIKITKITGSDGDQPVSIFYEGDQGKPWKPCKTMRRVLVGIWTKHAQEYVGRSLALYRDDKVTFGGLEVGGIRISHASHIDKEIVVVVMKSKGKKVGIKVLPLTDAPAKQGYDFLAGITACTTAALLRQWWTNHGDAIPDDQYEAVEAAFKAHAASFKSPRPAATAPGDDAPSTDEAAASAEGRDQADMGEFDADRETTDRLIADKWAGAGRSASEQAEYEALPAELRAEVDAA